MLVCLSLWVVLANYSLIFILYCGENPFVVDSFLNVSDFCGLLFSFLYKSFGEHWVSWRGERKCWIRKESSVPKKSANLYHWFFRLPTFYWSSAFLCSSLFTACGFAFGLCSNNSFITSSQSALLAHICLTWSLTCLAQILYASFLYYLSYFCLGRGLYYTTLVWLLYFSYLYLHRISLQ